MMLAELKIGPVQMRHRERKDEGARTDIADALRQSTLFACLSDEQLDRMARLVKRYEIAPGPIFLEGDRSNNAYLLISGRVDVSVSSCDGRELLLHRVGPGDFFGEMALLDQQPRSTCAIARTHCVILTISRPALLDAVSNSPELALRKIASLAQRLRVADESIKAISFLDMSARIARELLAMEQEQNGRGVVRVGQEELSAVLGCARQSITRTLAAWRRMGYASTGRGTIRLLNHRKLQALSRP